jgi:hypothetical protein
MEQGIRPRPPQALFELVPHDAELFEVKISWSPYDVIEVFGDKGRDILLVEAEEWLRDKANRLKNRSIEAGYDIIRDLVNDDIVEGGSDV